MTNNFPASCTVVCGSHYEYFCKIQGRASTINMAVCASRGFKKEPGASLSLVLLMHGLLVHSAPFGQSECPGHLSIPKYEEIRSQCRALYAERPRCNLTRFAVVAVFRFDRACNKSVDFYIVHPFCNLGFVT